MAELTPELKKQVGQHFVLGFLGEISDRVVSLIRDYGVGNIIVMKRNVRDIYHLRELISGLQQIAKDSGHAQPLMIGIDQENGLVSAFSTSTPTGGTQFPGAMALAATGSPEIAEAVSSATAKELSLAGINWVYSPVADINSDSRNPVIGVRSFGDDPKTVAAYVSAVSRGLTSQGIAPCPKHFPGHGDTHVDSHIALPKINKSLLQLEEAELIPFRAVASPSSKTSGGLEDEAVASIMTGHMALPLITGDDTPCSLSRHITTDLLRTSLGYKGVVVTDCLEMDAVADSVGVARGAVEALKAGADIIMICHRYDRQIAAIQATYAALASGELSIEEFHASSRRISALKGRFAGIWEHVLNPELSPDVSLSTIKEASLTLSRSAYDRSITIIRDPRGFIPFSIPTTKNGGILLFMPEMEMLNRAVDDAENIIRARDGKLRNTAGPSYFAFSAFIAARLSAISGVHPYEHIGYSRIDADTNEKLGDRVERAVKNATGIIFATRNADRSTWQIKYLHRILALLHGSSPASHDVPFCVLATCGPYDLSSPIAKEGGLLENVAYVGSFEFTVQALEAAGRVIFGDIKAVGTCPVKL